MGMKLFNGRFKCLLDKKSSHLTILINLIHFFRTDVQAFKMDSSHLLKRPPFTTDNQEIQHLAKQTLINRLFLGSYQERRYVDVLREYRLVDLNKYIYNF